MAAYLWEPFSSTGSKCAWFCANALFLLGVSFVPALMADELSFLKNDTQLKKNIITFVNGSLDTGFNDVCGYTNNSVAFNDPLIPKYPWIVSEETI